MCRRVHRCPAAVGRFRDQTPRALYERRISRVRSDDLGHLLRDAEFLLAVEHADRREDLHPHVVALPVGRRHRVLVELVNEGRSVLEKERDMRDLFPAHERRRQGLRERGLRGVRFTTTFLRAKSNSQRTHADVMRAVSAAFRSWSDLLAEQLAASGVPRHRAGTIACADCPGLLDRYAERKVRRKA